MGKYNISPDLINQLEILLHKESSVNRSNQIPSSPSIIQDAITAVGSAAEDAFRCTACNGELLRGSDSIICVFCGRFPEDSLSLRNPICFTDTLGFRLFLGSLSLDGSECVERPIKEGNELGRRRSPVKNEIPLSALLDLQLKWPDESNKFGVENEPGKQSAKFIGFNLDEFFQTEGSREGTSSSLNEQNVVNKNIEFKEDTVFAGQSSLSLFENSQTGSREGENDESDWAAEFQFQSANANVKVNSGFQMDSIHQPPKQEELANIGTFQALPTSVIGSKSEPLFESEQPESNMAVKDDQMGLGTVDASFDWLPAGDKQVIADEIDPPHNDKLDDVSGNNWDEFGVFSGAENNQVAPALQTILDVEKPVYGDGDDFALFGHASIEQQNAHVESMLNMTTNQSEPLGVQAASKEVENSINLWNDYESSDNGDNNQQQFTTKETPVAFGTSSPAGDGTFNVENDNSFDEWSDFAQSTAVLNTKPVSSDTAFGALGDLSSIMVTPNPLQIGETKLPENQAAMQDDDDFGSRSEFRSSWKQSDSSFSELNLNGLMQDNIVFGRDVENLSSVGDKNSQQFTTKEAPVSKLSPAGDGTFNVENDKSFDEWSDFAQSTAVLNTKPISSDTVFGALGDISSILGTPSNPPQIGETKAAENQTAMQDDDDFGSWSDFRSSWKQPDSNYSELNLNGSMQDNIVTGRDVDNLSSVKDKNSHNSWDDLGWSTPVLEQPSHAVEAKPSESKLTSEDRDLFLGFDYSNIQSSLPNNRLKNNGSAVQNDKSTSENDEEVDTWTDFVSTSNEQPNHWLSNNVETDATKEPVIHDPFGEWNVIGSSPNQEFGSVAAVANENFPQTNLFSNNTDSHFVGSSSSMHQDPFLFMLNDQNSSAHVASTRTTVPNLVGTEHQDAVAGDFDNKSKIAIMERRDQKSDVVENLISEMHDLSFMLESGLSIPKPGT